MMKRIVSLLVGLTFSIQATAITFVPHQILTASDLNNALSNAAITSGTISGTVITASPISGSTGAFTTLGSPSVALTGGLIDGTSLGSITPAAGAFTALSASGAVAGTGFSTYLASPPAIGGTAPAAGAFTTVTSTVATGTAPLVVTSTTPVANLNIGGNAANVTGVVAVSNGGTGATTSTQALTNLGAVGLGGGTNTLCTVGGTANAIALTPPLPLSNYASNIGMEYSFVATGTNTTAATISISGLAALTTTMGSVALPVGGIVSGNRYRVIVESATSIRVAPFDAVSVNGDTLNGNLTYVTGLADNTATLDLADSKFVKNQIAQDTNAYGIAQTVNTTYAGSGSSGTLISDNINANVGTSDFMLVWKGSVPSWNPTVVSFLMDKVTGSAGNFNGFRLAVNTTQLYLTMYRNDAGATFAFTTPTNFIAGTKHTITASVVRETATSAGSVSMYVDGILLGTQTITAITTVAINPATNLSVSGSVLSAVRSDSSTNAAYLYNRAMTAVGVLDLYRNGPNFADKWANQTALYTSNFSAGVDSWINFVTTNVAGAIDPLGGADTTWLECTPTAAGTAAVRNPNPIVPATGKKFRLAVTYYLPVGSPITALGFFDNSGTVPFIVTTVQKGAATTQVVEVTNTTAVTGLSAVATGAAIGSKFYFKAVVSTQIGATLALEPEGLQPDKWYDSSSNGQNGTYPASATLTRLASNPRQFTGGINATPVGAITPSTGVFTSLSSPVVTSTVATGTAPLVVTSTTPVANLSIGGNAATVTTNANLTGMVTSVGNATTVVTNANLTGDVTSTGNATTVGKINGTSLATLATGILKNTTTTGVPSIAVAGDFPTLNQSTTGNAATATNLAGGTGGTIPYQSAASTTAMLANGTAGYLLQSNGGTAAPSWMTLASPPSIGTTNAAAGAFTTLSASSTFQQGATVGGITLASFSTGTSSDNIEIRRASNGIQAPNIAFWKQRGSESTPAAVVAGDNLAQIDSYGFSGTANIGVASIISTADGTVSSTIIPSRWVFLTTNASGAMLEALRIDSSQNVLVTGPGGLGYGAGSGGTVTQATSRVTGVTLNKASGQITMFTAAGSTTPTSFTVTDSAVGANDVPVITIKSGATNTYVFEPTAVSAGSFVVSFWTTGGTASDTPVLQFNIIKGSIN